MDQLDLIDIYRTFHPQTMNFTFFSSARGSLSKNDHILGHKSSLGKLKKKKKLKSSQISFLITMWEDWMSTTGEKKLLKMQIYGG